MLSLITCIYLNLLSIINNNLYILNHLDKKIKYNINITDNIIDYHYGNKILNINDMKSTIKVVINSLSNINNNDHIINLIIETMIVETTLGKANFKTTAIKYNNHGIVQFRLDTAEYILNWLKNNNIIVYKEVMQFYNYNLTLKENVTNNVLFSIALCAQYYNKKSSLNNISTISSRAKVWKKHYNTYLGVGSVNKYIKRVKKFYKDQNNGRSKTWLSTYSLY